MSEQSSIAVVTGGSRGLGRSTVLALAGQGVSSIFTYNKAKGEADEVVDLAGKAGARAVAFQLDTGDTAAFAPFAEKVGAVLKDWGADRFDYLVNNAGVGQSAAIGEVTEEDFDNLYRIHLKGVLFLTQALLPLIRDGGRIVNLSTSLTRIIYPGRASYAAMKGAVEVLTRYMAKELGPRRIAVNAVAPGAIETDFSGGIVRDDPKLNKHISEVTALGRPGLPDDIGPMIASLLSEQNRWVNAQRIEVSGGQQL